MTGVLSKLCYTSATAVFAATLGLAATNPAQATNLPDFTMGVGSSETGDPIYFDPTEYGSVEANEDGTFTYIGDYMGSGGVFTVGWDSTIDPGSLGIGGLDSTQIIANIVVTNNSNMTQTFFASQSMGIVSPPYAGSTITGSITGTLTSNDTGGGSVSAPGGGSIYSATIDGSTVATLLDDPFSESVGAFESETVGPADFGPMAGGPANSTIGIDLEFDLTPGESASFTSIFVVNEVPAPGAMALLGIAGLFGRRRRR